MALKKFILAVAVVATLYACGSSRYVQRQHHFQPDKPVTVVTSQTDTPTVTPSDTLEIGKSARININKVAQHNRETWQGQLQHRLDSMANLTLFETTQLGLCVYDLTDGQLLYSLNANQRMRPASNMKLVTAISALHHLGSQHPFVTRLYTSGKVSEDGILTGNIYLQGGMDPMLSQGNIYQLAKSLTDNGISTIAGNIYLDHSRKDDKALGWGWCWDDDYGPLTTLTVDDKTNFGPEWIAALRAQGIKMTNANAQTGTTPANAKLIAQEQHTLTQVLDRMMKKSDNIYAESAFYQLAFKGGKKGAGRKEAASLVNQLIKETGLNPSNYVIADGSGVSLYNYLSPNLLLTLLCHAYKQPEIYKALYPSLPISGVDGTLSKRMNGTIAEGKIHAKTGTVTGVSTLSGYCTNSAGHTLAFSIMNQGIPTAATGRNFQDAVCVQLCK